MNTTQTNKLYGVDDPTVKVPDNRYTINSVISRDGTRIQYLQLGTGPGVVMLHGAMRIRSQSSGTC